MFSVNQIEYMAKYVIDYYKTEKITEKRSLHEIGGLLDKMSRMGERRTVTFSELEDKVVGEQLSWSGILIKVYNDQTGGIIISCDSSLGQSRYSDGEVFVSHDGGCLVFDHGRWENVLHKLYNLAIDNG